MIIAAAGNTEVPACLVLESKGFRVTIRRDTDAQTEIWTAIKGDLTLHGSSPLELLGLLTLHDARGDDWRASDSDVTNFLQRFGPAR
jgi:hypothetical protein